MMNVYIARKSLTLNNKNALPSKHNKKALFNWPVLDYE